MRRWLVRERNRHGLALAVTLLLTLVILLGWGRTSQRDLAALEPMLIGPALYGPVYLVLTRWTFHGRTGSTLRALLARSDFESSGRRRWWLGITPGSWAFVVGMLSLCSPSRC